MQVLDKRGHVYTQEKDVGHEDGGWTDLHLLLGDFPPKGVRLGVLAGGVPSYPENQEEVMTVQDETRLLSAGQLLFLEPSTSKS